MNDFITGNHDGKIIRAELIKTVRTHPDDTVRTALGLTQKIGEKQRGAVEEVFQGMDTDNSRCVDESEFSKFMRKKRQTSLCWCEASAEPCWAKRRYIERRTNMRFIEILDAIQVDLHLR